MCLKEEYGKGTEDPKRGVTAAVTSLLPYKLSGKTTGLNVKNVCTSFHSWCYLLTHAYSRILLFRLPASEISTRSPKLLTTSATAFHGPFFWDARRRNSYTSLRGCKARFSMELLAVSSVDNREFSIYLLEEVGEVLHRLVTRVYLDGLLVQMYDVGSRDKATARVLGNREVLSIGKWTR